MIKNLLGGMAFGIANIIPGVSGGTIIVLLGLFDKTMEAISNVFKIKISFKERMKSFTFLLQVMIGVAIGLVGFAKVLDFLFSTFEHQTLFLFAGLIIFSLPMLKKQEMDNKKISIPFFIIGVLVIGILAYFAPAKKEVVVPLSDLLAKNLDVAYILILMVMGAISGAAMLFPGISGSMVLLVLGYYYLYKSYVSNVTSFEPMVLIPLIFIAIGVGIGIIGSAKLTTYLLDNYRQKTMSLILGLVMMSGIVIIPRSGYNLTILISSIICFIIGSIFIIFFNKLKR